MKMKNNYETFKNNLKPGFMFTANDCMCLTLSVATESYTLFFINRNIPNHVGEFSSFPIEGMRFQDYEIIVPKAKRY